MRRLKRPKGVAFEIADLLQARGWAAFHDWRMQIWLDHGMEGEEYEEVIALDAGTSRLAGSTLWRTAKAVIVQPLLGRRRRYASVAAALDSLLPKQRIATNIAVPASSGCHS